MTVDLEGLADRVEALPLSAANYRQLRAAEGELLFLDAASGDFNRFDYREPPPRELKAFSYGSRSVRTLAEGVDAYSLAADGGHVAYRAGDSVTIISLDPGPGAQPAPSDSGPKPLDLSRLVARVDPPAEWRQVFDEAWRMERDFYYEPGMNGLDWPAVRAKYLPLLERATRPATSASSSAS